MAEFKTSQIWARMVEYFFKRDDLLLNAVKYEIGFLGG